MLRGQDSLRIGTTGPIAQWCFGKGSFIGSFVGVDDSTLMLGCSMCPSLDLDLKVRNPSPIRLPVDQCRGNELKWRMRDMEMRDRRPRNPRSSRARASFWLVGDLPAWSYICSAF